MEALRQELRRLITNNDIPAVMQRLPEVLNTSSQRFIDYALLKKQFDSATVDKRRGVEASRDVEIRFNQVTQGLIGLVSDLAENDLLIQKSDDKDRKILHPFHRFTCDRKVHNLKFVKQYQAKKEAKTHFFYLYGEEKQSPHGLFQRFAHHVEGSLLDYRNENTERTSESIKEEITFELYNDLEVDQQEVLSNLFAEMNVPFDSFEPIAEKKLDFLLENSPRIQELESDDFVCILLDISSYNWDAESVPTLIKWFCGTFCKVDLPEDSPTFLFFFAIIFEEPDEEVEKEVETSLAKSEFLFPLPELNNVPYRDIKMWFSTYRFITSTQESRAKLIETFFPETEEYDMEKIEKNLEKIITDYNNNLLE